MGVFALQSYVEKNCPEAISKVDIRDLASKFRRYQSQRGSKRPQARPKVIVDLYALFGYMYSGLDMICGGQGKLYQRRWAIFFEAFESAGIELVFVADGPAPESKHQTWVRRQYDKKLKIITPLFDSLIKGASPVEVSLPPSLMITHLMEEIFHKAVTISTSDKDGDQLIAELADENTIGILSQDSDFLIYQYPEHVKYLSINDFNLEALLEDHRTLKTVAYSREVLAHHLDCVVHSTVLTNCRKFEVGHLPLFASLKGNDVISCDDLKKFHLHLTTPVSGRWQHVAHHKAIMSIASFICKENIPPERPSLQFLEELSVQVFNDSRRIEDLENCISGYFLIPSRPVKSEMLGSAENKTNSTSQSQIEDERHWKILTNLFKEGSTIHTLMSGATLKTCAFLEDSRVRDIPSNTHLHQKLRQRIYSILFFEKPRKIWLDIYVREWCMAGDNSLDEAVMQRIDNAPDFHPGLENLMNRNNKSFDTLRWKIFTYIISPELEPRVLQNLKDSSFIYPVCQLYIMQHDCQTPVLFKWEVELFLLEHMRFQKLTVRQCHEIALQEIIPDPRGVQLATLYTRSRVDLASKMTGNIVPIPCLLPLYSSFDGIHFQQMYKHYKKFRFIDADLYEWKEISSYFNLITNNGLYVKQEPFSYFDYCGVDPLTDNFVRL